MFNEVKMIVGQLSDDRKHIFERHLAHYLDDGWIVLGFSTVSDVENGDRAYVLLQRAASEPQSAPQPTGQEPTAG